MSGVNVTITGVLFDRLNRTAQNVTLIGEALLSDLEVGGGPIIPPPRPGGRPPNPDLPGKPTHPIPPIPEHPIVLPPGGGTPPTEPPIDPPTQPPQPSWSWVWNPQTDWIPAYVPEGGKPHPVPPGPGVPTPPAKPLGQH